MSILKIARMGHPVLRSKPSALEPAEIRATAVQRLIDDMLETMHEYRGIGLAATQVHERRRLFVAGIEEEEGAGGRERDLPVFVFINPEIKAVGGETTEDWEGCLSVPDLRGRVPRHSHIKIRALDRRGARFDMDVRGYVARVLQHEADHLDGKLFVDRMKSLESLSYLEEFAKFRSKD
jgi:peptide deformylase